MLIIVTDKIFYSEIMQAALSDDLRARNIGPRFAKVDDENIIFLISYWGYKRTKTEHRRNKPQGCFFQNFDLLHKN